MRKQFQTSLTIGSELQKLLEDAREVYVTEEQLREQRISFAFGNAMGCDGVTKETVRRAAERIRLEELRAEAKRRLAAPRPRLVRPDPPPRYDEVFSKGLAALEED